MDERHWNRSLSRRTLLASATVSLAATLTGVGGATALWASAPQSGHHATTTTIS